MCFPSISSSISCILKTRIDRFLNVVCLHILCRSYIHQGIDSTDCPKTLQFNINFQQVTREEEKWNEKKGKEKKKLSEKKYKKIISFWSIGIE